MRRRWTCEGMFKTIRAVERRDVMAGDIDANTAQEKVEKYFGNMPRGRRWAIKKFGWRSDGNARGTVVQTRGCPPGAGADLQGVDIPRVRQIGQRLLGFGERYFDDRENFADFTSG